MILEPAYAVKACSICPEEVAGLLCRVGEIVVVAVADEAANAAFDAAVDYPRLAARQGIESYKVDVTIVDCIYHRINVVCYVAVGHSGICTAACRKALPQFVVVSVERTVEAKVFLLERCKRSPC